MKKLILFVLICTSYISIGQSVRDVATQDIDTYDMWLRPFKITKKVSINAQQTITPKQFLGNIHLDTLAKKVGMRVFGVMNLNNTLDIDKPISIAAENRLGLKVDKVTGKGLSVNDFSNTYKIALDGLDGKFSLKVNTSTLADSITSLNNKIASKASIASVSLKVNTSTLADSITSLNNKIAGKASIASVSLKVNTSTLADSITSLNNKIASKASIASVSLKSDLNYTIQKLHTVTSISALQAFTDANVANFDGSDWERKSGNVASNGGAFAGTIVNISSSFYWERKVDKYVTFEMFGAKGDGIADDYIPISNTFLNANNIFVSSKTFICSQPITQIQSNTTIIGLGKKSEIKFTYVGESHFIAIQNKQNILIDNLYVNANAIGRMTGGVTAVQGGAILFYNSEIAKKPRLNNITIQNCFIGANGFNGIGAVNAHAINVFNNYFYLGRDSGIAATSGSSQWNIVGNHFEDTNQFPISLSNNGVTPADYNAVGMVRDCIIQGNFINVSASSGYGIELDGVDHIKVLDNIITVNQDVTYGIRLISSLTFTNVFDVYNVEIKNNTIINKSTSNRVGIEVFNTGTSSPDNNITLSGNTITNQVESNFKGISLLNATIKCSKNIINSTVGKFNVGIALEVYGVNNGIEIDISDNDISGGVIGVQTTNLTNQASLFLTRNKIRGNSIATLGLNAGWNTTFSQNNLTGDIYNSGLTTRGDIRYYTSSPTSGTWKVGEIVKNANPVSAGYESFICISGGTPGTWKGVGLIQ